MLVMRGKKRKMKEIVCNFGKYAMVRVSNNESTRREQEKKLNGGSSPLAKPSVQTSGDERDEKKIKRQKT